MASVMRTGSLLKVLFMAMDICCIRPSSAQDMEVRWELTRDSVSGDTDRALGVAFDEANDIIVTGTTRGAFEGFNNSGGSDLFVMKVLSSGSLSWTQQLSSNHSTASVEGGYVALDEAGDIFTLVSAEGSFANAPNQGTRDVAVLKFTPNGVLDWAYQTGTSADDHVAAIALTEAGDIVITGHTFGSFNGAQTFGLLDLFVAKIFANLTLAWWTQLGSSSMDWSRAIVANDAGDVFVASEASTELGAGGQPFGRTLAYLFMFAAADGTNVWTELIQPANGGVDVTGLAVNQDGDLLLGGTVFGFFQGYTQSNSDVFVTKVLSNGARTWTVQMGNSGPINVRGLQVDAAGDIIVVGRTQGAWPGFSLQGIEDTFLMKILANGTLSWTFQFGRNQARVAVTSLAIGNSGDMAVAGTIITPTSDDIYVAKVSSRSSESMSSTAFSTTISASMGEPVVSAASTKVSAAQKVAGGAMLLVFILLQHRLG